MKISEEEIEKAKSEKGGWTRQTLAKWGVPWPPPKGWKRALIRGRPLPQKRRVRNEISKATFKRLDMIRKQLGENNG